MEILNRLLEISVYSAVLFLAIMAIKKSLKNKLSPILHFLIWFLLIARLCIPVTIDSGLKLIVLPESIPAASSQIQKSDQTTVPGSTSAPASNALLNASSPNVSQSHTDQPNNRNPQFSDSAHANFPQSGSMTWADILIVLWLVGLTLSIVWMITIFIKMNRMIGKHGVMPSLRIREIMAECMKEWGIDRVIPVYLLPNISTPALTVGFWPKLLLPADLTDTLSEQQLVYAIKHELTHYKRKDHLTGLLLRILEAVYWFNPVIWLTGRCMTADMETACDSMVIETLDERQKKQYVLTLLDMFSSKKAPQYLIGMALNHTEKIAERRIRGAYMSRKSKRSAKLTAGALAVLLFVGCFTTACQPTPEKPVVVNKAGGLSDLIDATPSVSSSVAPNGTPSVNNDALYEKLAAPRHWSFEESALDGKLNLKADVDIELPAVTQLPAATGTLSEFTQEDLNKVAELFGAGDATWTNIDHTMTKEQIQQEIIDHQTRRAEFKAEGNDEMVEKMDEDLKDYEQMYNDAPEEIEQKNVELKIGELYRGKELNGDTITLMGFEGTTEANGQPVYFMASSGYTGDAVNRISVNYGSEPAFFGGVIGVDKPFGISLAKGQAGEQAGEIARQLTDELTLCYVYPATMMNRKSGRKWGWACVFMREINGCPTAYESTEIGSDMETTVDAPIAYERMTIMMDDQGIVGFTWNSPMTVTSIDNADVAVLPFEEIFNRAKEHIIQRWAYEAVGAKDNDGNDVSDPGCTAIITKVNLGLMRVAKANSDDYYYIPVWNFFSDMEHTPGYYERMGYEPKTQDMLVDENGNTNGGVTDGDPAAWGAVTVNALDGSIIDRNLGY